MTAKLLRRAPLPLWNKILISDGFSIFLLSTCWAQGSRDPTLFQTGVQEYRAGHSLQAMGIFLEVLDREPQNEIAKQYIWNIGKQLRETKKSLYPTAEEQKLWVEQAKTKVTQDDKKIKKTMQDLLRAFSEVQKNPQPTSVLAFLDIADPMIQKDPEIQPILTAKADALFRQAYNDLQKAIASKSLVGKGDLLKAQGYLAYYQNQWPEAVRLWGMALQENPQDSALKERLGRVRAYLEQKRREQEVQHLEEQARVYLQSEFYDDAIESWKEALRWMPDHPHAKQEMQRISRIKMQKDNEALSQRYFRRGIEMYKQKKYIDAIQNWIDTLSINPHHHEARQWLQVVGRRVGGTALAPMEPSKTPPTGAMPQREEEKQDAASVKDLYRQALIDYSQGDISNAKELLQKVLKLDPRHDQAQKALKRIEAELSVSESE